MAASGVRKDEDVRVLQQSPEANVRIIQVSGLVKWFDVGRGYGFIIPDNGMQDILLHLSCLKRDGFEAGALPGKRLSCLARQQFGEIILDAAPGGPEVMVEVENAHWLDERRR